MFKIILLAAEGLLASSHVPCTAIAVPLRKRGSSGTIAKMCKNRCLTIATETARAVVIKDDVLNDIEAKTSPHLSPKTGEAKEALLQAMKTVYCVYTE